MIDLYQITTPFAVGGVVFKNGVVVRWAPIFRKWVFDTARGGMSLDTVRATARARRWGFTHVGRYDK